MRRRVAGICEQKGAGEPVLRERAAAGSAPARIGTDTVYGKNGHHSRKTTKRF
jgi:hypothetical protein